MKRQRSSPWLTQSYRPMDRSRHCVYVGLNTHFGYGRAFFEGIIAYAQKVGTWRFQYQFEPNRHPEQLAEEIRADGIIIEGHDPQVLAPVLALNLPTVLVAVGPEEQRLPKVIPHAQAVGHMAFEYFRELGFDQLAWCDAGAWYSQAARAFQSHAQAHAVPCHLFQYQAQHPEALEQWLRDLPKPVGVLANTNGLGVILIDACNQADIKVPEEVAVLSVGLDDILCNISRPTLSTLDQGQVKIGYEAAALLDAQLTGRPFERTIVVQPVGIYQRQSTDTLAIGDPDIVAAVRYLRENAFEPIRVDDILQVVPISRRSLEMGFRKYLHRTVYEEILRVRLERAKSLLIRSDLAMPDVAVRSGFASASQLSVVFRRELQTTPGAFRIMHRMR